MLLRLRVRVPPLDSEEAAELYVDEVLDGSGRFLYLDSIGSVRGLDQDEDGFASGRDIYLFSIGDPHGF